MKKIKMVWIKPVKFSPIKLSMFPKRTKAEVRLIDRNPWGDTDRDKVPNIFDCKPLNRKKQGAHNIIKLYHGTSRESAKMIKKEGFNPNMGMSSRGIFLTPSKFHAERYNTGGMITVKIPTALIQDRQTYRGNQTFSSPPLTFSKNEYKKLSGARKFSNGDTSAPFEESDKTTYLLDEVTTQELPIEYLEENYPQKPQPQALQAMYPTIPPEDIIEDSIEQDPEKEE